MNRREILRYTALVTVCDQVCNTAFMNWSFIVDHDGGGWITFEPPYHVSAMPHTFVMMLTNDDIDETSLNLTIEGSMWIEPEEGDPYEAWSEIVTGAAVDVNGSEVTYTANFDLTSLHSIRLTMSGCYEGSIPAADVSQNYVVDIGIPTFTSVLPNPEALLTVDAPITFQVEFAEVGNTALDPDAVKLRLTTAGGELVAEISREAQEETGGVEIAPNGRTGRAWVPVDGLAAGAYVLYAEIADVAGNHATMTWDYQVGTGDPEIDPEAPTYNFPNPFEPGGYTTFVLPLSEGFVNEAYVSINLYDLSGRFVANVWDGAYHASDQATWNGENENGDEVANGVYLAHIKVKAGNASTENVVKVAFKKADK